MRGRAARDWRRVGVGVRGDWGEGEWVGGWVDGWAGDVGGWVDGWVGGVGGRAVGWMDGGKNVIFWHTLISSSGMRQNLSREKRYRKSSSKAWRLGSAWYRVMGHRHFIAACTTVIRNSPE